MESDACSRSSISRSRARWLRGSEILHFESITPLDTGLGFLRLRRFAWEAQRPMYAVIASGGKQYRVSEGETLRVEKLAGPAGTKVTFGPLLFADDGGGVQVGRPTVAGVTVEAEIVEQGLAKKIIIFKYKRRKSYRRKAGHRQPFTSLKITAISAGSAEAKA